MVSAQDNQDHSMGTVKRIDHLRQEYLEKYSPVKSRVETARERLREAVGPNRNRKFVGGKENLGGGGLFSREDKVSKEELNAPPLFEGQPSIRRPLVYYHQRDSLGSYLEKALYKTYVAKGGKEAETWVPCWTPGVECERSLPRPRGEMARVRVIAAHLPFGVIDTHIGRIEGLDFATLWNKEFDDLSYQCLTTIRHPVDRLEACARRYFPNRNFETATFDEVYGLLTSTAGASSAGVSCLAEPVRIFSSSLAEDDINGVATDPEAIRSELLAEWAMENMNKCVTLVTDSPDEARELLHHVVPWLSEVRFIDKDMSASMWPADVRLELEQTLARNEMEVYAFAKNLMARQLERYRQSSSSSHELPDFDIGF
eukprot:CAMPEP_0119128494 /NCGR_PEP_ID=MMETSP1310-20130426/6628_1 /TAXON_ID=464262 /ORGANISM="Genus nov. species nov., Strain RCC2339" /LENGTH=370 /DNA_ID=CAMNT_0007118839 /DNA_START=180 /DNA_END=1292 /DNA_ORIENTATION=-